MLIFDIFCRIQRKGVASRWQCLKEYSKNALFLEHPLIFFMVRNDDKRRHGGT